ncbi:MAG: ABC transporter permease [Candidatus Dormibacteria bacterium]|jgi:ABC-2 type transport system permease protein
MNLRRTGAISLRILQQFRHDRRTLMLLFGVPIILLGLFYFLTGAGSGLPAVDVVNQDHGPMGAIVVADLSRSSEITVTETTATRAESDLSADTVAAFVVLPPDLSARALSDAVIAPTVHLEGTQPALTQPVLLALDQSVTRASTSLAATEGVRVPVLEPTLDYLHGGPGLDTLDYFGGAFIGLVVFLLVFVVSIIAFLRERSQGTLERLMASPLGRADIVVGYIGGFMVVAALQAVEVVVFTLYALHVHNQGNVALIVLLTLLMTLVAVNLAIFLSMFATTEFQAVQFIPLTIVPQVLLSGIIFPITTEPGWLQVVSRLLPLTYGVDGLRDVMLKGDAITSGPLLIDLAVVVAFALALIGAATATLRSNAS